MPIRCSALDSLWHHDWFRSRGITAVCDDISAADGKLRTLTPCERETARLISEGYSTKETADKLGVGPKTTETTGETSSPSSRCTRSPSWSATPRGWGWENRGQSLLSTLERRDWRHSWHCPFATGLRSIGGSAESARVMAAVSPPWRGPVAAKAQSDFSPAATLFPSPRRSAAPSQISLPLASRRRHPSKFVYPSPAVGGTFPNLFAPRRPSAAPSQICLPLAGRRRHPPKFVCPSPTVGGTLPNLFAPRRPSATRFQICLPHADRRRDVLQLLRLFPAGGVQFIAQIVTAEGPAPHEWWADSCWR